MKRAPAPAWAPDARRLAGDAAASLATACARTLADLDGLRPRPEPEAPAVTLAAAAALRAQGGEAWDRYVARRQARAAARAENRGLEAQLERAWAFFAYYARPDSAAAARIAAHVAQAWPEAGDPRGGWGGRRGLHDAGACGPLCASCEVEAALGRRP